MKKLIVFICASITLAACTGDNNALSKIEGVLNKNESVVEIERDLKEDVSKEDATSDLSAGQLNPQENTTPQESKTEQTKQINLTSQEISIMSESTTIKTSKGNIVLELYPEVAPETVKNFLSKAKSDYYKGLIFHRVEDWVIQGGDPLGTGTGGGTIPTELSDTPFEEGSLGVARGGDVRISNDSQFFICTKDCSWLTGQYTVFGKVLEGMDVVKSIQIGDTIDEIEPLNETNN